MVVMARDAMEYTCETAADEARRTTAFRNYTGRLRKSIKGGLYKTSGPGIVGVLTAGDDDASPGKQGWETPSRTYSVFVELGTAQRPPHAFVHPTVLEIGYRGVLSQALQRRFEQWRA